MNGTKGLEEGHHAHILDACEIIKDCWDAVSEETIGKCWLKASTLSPANERYLRDKFNVKVPQHELNPRYEVDDLINEMVRLDLSKSSRLRRTCSQAFFYKRLGIPGRHA